jgi:hypothetical protein
MAEEIQSMSIHGEVTEEPDGTYCTLKAGPFQDDKTDLYLWQELMGQAMDEFMKRTGAWGSTTADNERTREFDYSPNGGVETLRKLSN